MPDLSLQITKYLSQYTKDVQEVLEKVTDESTKQATDKLKQLSPKRTGKYAKSWTRKRSESGYIIYNRRYYLTHLLEKGHAKRGGGRVEGIKHIEPVEQEAINNFEEQARRAIDDIG